MPFLKLKETKQYQGSIKTSDDKPDTSTQLKLDLTSSIMGEITKVVSKEGLEDIYNQIPMENAPQPVSFNFELINLKIKDFRSISEYEMDFSDKNIFLSGHNGSGKSSVLMALVTALLGDARIATFSRDVGKAKRLSCRLEVNLKYNDKVYTIIRAPGKTEFIIDGVACELGNKRLMDAEIYKELPFLEHLKAFIINPNTHFFDNVDRTELIKTCFNLSVLDFISEQAGNLSGTQIARINQVKEMIITTQSAVEVNNENLRDQTLNLKEAESKIPEGITEKGLDEHMKSLSAAKAEIDTLRSKLQTMQSTIEYKQKTLDLNSGLNQSEIERMLEIHKLNDEFNQGISTLKTGIATIERKEENLKSAYNALEDHTTICPHCKEVLKKDESFERRKQELIEEHAKVKAPYQDFVNQLNSLENDYKEFIAKYDITVSNGVVEGLKGKAQLDKELAALAQTKALQDEIVELKNKYEILKEQEKQTSANALVLLGGMDYQAKVAELLEYASIFKSVKLASSMLDRSKDALEKAQKSLVTLNESLIEEQEVLNRINKFKELFNQKNLDSIPYQIISLVLDNINSEEVQFTSTKQLSSGEDRFNVSCKIRIAENLYMDYDSASDGQKVILDIYILEKILNLLGNVGLLIMDESLTNLDEINFNRVKGFLDSVRCGNLLLTSHNPNFEGVDRVITVKLNTDGVSEFN